MQPRASVVGLGLIGASIALSLRRANWHVSGSDLVDRHASRALEQRVIDEVVELVDPDSTIVFVATPPLSIAQTVNAVAALVDPLNCVITDTGSVKAPITRECSFPNFVPGHPMAGSEMTRLEGASATLFEGSTWILTPSSSDEGALARVAHVVQQDLKAELRLMDSVQHDELAAAVSHVPHLLASALVTTAFEFSESHESVLARMASGSFRDMTRVAGGEPSIWLDICKSNSDAITKLLDKMVTRLTQLNDVLRSGEVAVVDSTLHDQFLSARKSRRQLPEVATKHVELVISIGPNKSVQEVMGIATTLDVSIRDFYVTNDRGEMVVSVPSSHAEMLRGGLSMAGIRSANGNGLSN